MGSLCSLDLMQTSPAETSVSDRGLVVIDPHWKDIVKEEKRYCVNVKKAFQGQVLGYVTPVRLHIHYELIQFGFSWHHKVLRSLPERSKVVSRSVSSTSGTPMAMTWPRCLVPSWPQCLQCGCSCADEVQRPLTSLDSMTMTQVMPTEGNIHYFYFF